MNIAELLTDYKKQAIICSLVNYADKASVRKNNRAVNKMYAIVDAMVEEYGSNAPESFKELLDISEYKINLWAAVQLLERFKIQDEFVQQKALRIIRHEAESNSMQAIGFEYWLKEWDIKNNKKASI